jgi:hypothetical protein
MLRDAETTHQPIHAPGWQPEFHQQNIKIPLCYLCYLLFKRPVLPQPIPTNRKLSQESAPRSFRMQIIEQEVTEETESDQSRPLYAYI